MAKMAVLKWFTFVFICFLVGCSSGIEEVRSAVSTEPQDAMAADTHQDLPTASPDVEGDAEESASDASEVGDGSDVSDAGSDTEDSVYGEMDTAPPPIPCPGACSGHGTCDGKTGICACFPLFDGAACEKCKPDHDGYPFCKPACVLLSHTYTEAPPSSSDMVKRGPSLTKTVPVYCPEHPECIGGFSEVTDFASLIFAPGCTNAKFVYKGKRHFDCAGKLIPPVAVHVILQLNGAVYWTCPVPSVMYVPSGDLTVNCEVNPKALGLLPPYSIKPYLKLMNPKGDWYGMEIGPPSPVCVP